MVCFPTYGAACSPLAIRLTKDLRHKFDKWPTYQEMYDVIMKNALDIYDQLFCLKYNDQVININNFDDLPRNEPIELQKVKLVPAPSPREFFGVKSSYLSYCRALNGISTSSVSLGNYKVEDRDTCMVFGKTFPDLPANEGVKQLLLEHRNNHHSRDVINCHILAGNMYLIDYCNTSHPKAEKLTSESTRVEIGVWYVIGFFLEILILTVFYDPFKQKYYLISMDLNNKYVTETFHGKEIHMDNSKINNLNNDQNNLNNNMSNSIDDDNMYESKSSTCTPVNALSKRAVGIHFLHSVEESRRRKWTTPPLLPMYSEILGSLSDDDHRVQVEDFFNPRDVFHVLNVEINSDDKTSNSRQRLESVIEESNQENNNEKRKNEKANKNRRNTQGYRHGGKRKGKSKGKGKGQSEFDYYGDGSQYNYYGGSENIGGNCDFGGGFATNNYYYPYQAAATAQAQEAAHRHQFQPINFMSMSGNGVGVGGVADVAGVRGAASLRGLPGAGIFPQIGGVGIGNGRNNMHSDLIPTQTQVPSVGNMNNMNNINNMNMNNMNMNNIMNMNNNYNNNNMNSMNNMNNHLYGYNSNNNNTNNHMNRNYTNMNNNYNMNNANMNSMDNILSGGGFRRHEHLSQQYESNRARQGQAPPHQEPQGH